MNAAYNYYLVVVSLAVAVLASYTALDVTSRIQALQAAGSRRGCWLLAGAAVMGTGIWSMHFIGMLAYRMPMWTGYDLWFTLLSLLIAIAFSFFGLRAVSRLTVDRRHLAFGSVGMGLAIAAMHYTGMLALRMGSDLSYNYALVFISVAIAVSASWMALYVTTRMRDDNRHVVLKRCVAGLILGLAVAGMHYTGMSAARFSAHAADHGSTALQTAWLASIVAAATFFLLIGTLIFSRMDRGYDTLSALMNASLDDVHQQLLTMATRDTLTGLANRASLLLRMQEMILRSGVTGRPFTVMFTDLDGFKTINDSLGHAAGDNLLVKFSRHLKSSIRSDDTVARLGGDEFVLLLDGIALPAEIDPIARKILQRMQQDFLIGGTPLRVTASIGIASFPQDGRAAEELLKNADIAMYDSKQRGKNTFRYYDIEMSRAAARTLCLYRALAEAFDTNQLSLHFQPKFGGANQEMIGAEALIRWTHPELGDIAPLEFIPIAERTGQIVRVGNWVIEEVCRYLRQWDNSGMPPIKVAINLSPEQLCFPRYIDSVLAITRAAAIPAERIMFEITETAAMRNAELSADVLAQFQLAGFEIAIDDFGTGYSSLAYLQRFRVKQLKIDRYFIQGLGSGGSGGIAIVAAIIAMAHSLDMVVVAEGVELDAQLTQLQNLRCDEMQGYLLAKPLNATDFEVFVRARSHIVINNVAEEQVMAAKAELRSFGRKSVTAIA